MIDVLLPLLLSTVALLALASIPAAIDLVRRSLLPDVSWDALLLGTTVNTAVAAALAIRALTVPTWAVDAWWREVVDVGAYVLFWGTTLTAGGCAACGAALVGVRWLVAGPTRPRRGMWVAAGLLGAADLALVGLSAPWGPVPLLAALWAGCWLAWALCSLRDGDPRVDRAREPAAALLFAPVGFLGAAWGATRDPWGPVGLGVAVFVLGAFAARSVRRGRPLPSMPAQLLVLLAALGLLGSERRLQDGVERFGLDVPRAVDLTGRVPDARLFFRAPPACLSVDERSIDARTGASPCGAIPRPAPGQGIRVGLRWTVYGPDEPASRVQHLANVAVTGLPDVYAGTRTTGALTVRSLNPIAFHIPKLAITSDDDLEAAHARIEAAASHPDGVHVVIAREGRSVQEAVSICVSAAVAADAHRHGWECSLSP